MEARVPVFLEVAVAEEAMKGVPLGGSVS